MSGTTITQPRPHTCAPSRAARELELKRGEFDLAVHLGRIRTVPDEGGGGGRRIEHAEIDRLRAQDGFPEVLRDGVRAVGTTEGAKIMNVPVTRFTRLARLGLVVPVKYYLNRYRAVVWLYLAQELEEFANDEKNSFLLTGRTPEVLRAQLTAGVDLRARNWRGRHLGFLLRLAEEPWHRAGAVAAFLDPAHVADVVRDPYERSHLNRFRPAPPTHGAPGSPSAHLAQEIMTASDQDEIGWLRNDLARAVEEARGHRPAPSPAPRGEAPATPHSAPLAQHRATAAPRRASAPETSVAPEQPRRLLGWLRRRSPRPPCSEASGRAAV
ncbi:DUF6397 family protein [Streptomyces olivochromogenes]|uniref:DUF6397 family protein n=1 Tax=Streptomyces olivochromogenes TaxID=1963 RepID=UPI001F214543|nr:DUF6397 family protein [Streptomyces olivochromogenes]MCF3131438.1 hypothetical protein [Streptomyces olivochromogenes]